MRARSTGGCRQVRIHKHDAIAGGSVPLLTEHLAGYLRSGNYLEKGLLQGNIMVVDDNPANLRLLEEMLRQHGYEVRSFPRGRLALAAADQEPPDLILLDINMPEMNGYEVCEQLKSSAHLSGIPVIFLSALNATEDKVKGFRSGGVDYISKPFQIEEVQARVETHLEIRFLQAQLIEHNQILDRKVRERTRQLVDAQFEIAKRLALAAEYRDDSTGQHTYRVGRLAARLAAAIGLGDEEVELFQQAAPLHDVGKIGIPDAILLKPGKLRDDEYQIVKTHTDIGARILSGSRHPLLQMAERIAQYHHERWDGSGYNGLKGEEIPLEARIVTIADVFDVMTHDRCYKKAQSYDQAVVEIQRCRGRDFDPRLVDAFLRLTQDIDLKNLCASLCEDVEMTPEESSSLQLLSQPPS
jgi:putative two-component system response regulator